MLWVALRFSAAVGVQFELGLQPQRFQRWRIKRIC
jgi:hypothetical protein